MYCAKCGTIQNDNPYCARCGRQNLPGIPPQPTLPAEAPEVKPERKSGLMLAIGGIVLLLVFGLLLSFSNRAMSNSKSSKTSSGRAGGATGSPANVYAGGSEQTGGSEQAGPSSGGGAASGPPSPINVEYVVVARNTNAVTVSYRNAQAGTDSVDPMPREWSTKFTAVPGVHLQISAQNHGSRGRVEVFIFCGNRIVSHAGSTAHDPTATCEYDIP